MNNTNDKPIPDKLFAILDKLFVSTTVDTKP